MANVELPKEIASVSGAISRRTNYDGSVTVTYFKTRNGKTRMYTTTYFPRKPTEKECKQRKAFADAVKAAGVILQHKCEKVLLEMWEDKYQNYLAHVSPKDLEKKRYKTFRGFLIGEIFASYKQLIP